MSLVKTMMRRMRTLLTPTIVVLMGATLATLATLAAAKGAPPSVRCGYVNRVAEWYWCDPASRSCVYSPAHVRPIPVKNAPAYKTSCVLVYVTMASFAVGLLLDDWTAMHVVMQCQAVHVLYAVLALVIGLAVDESCARMTA